MSDKNKLETFVSKDSLLPFKGTFLVPSNWSSCGVVVYVSGGKKLDSGQPIAMVLTDASISLCDQSGPVQSVPLGSIRDISAVDLSGYPIPSDTPSGVMDMLLPRSKGVKFKYELNPMGTQLELTLYTLTPKAAYDWVNIISSAIHNKLSDFGRDGDVISRK